VRNPAETRTATDAAPRARVSCGARVANRFGAYEILYELKTGGMGAVLLGRRRGPGAFEQLVAIKTIRPEYAQAEAVRAMFLDEAAILARLGHPGVATVHDFGEQGGMLYMVMEYVAGISFRDALELGMPPLIAARAIAESCRGLHAAHELRDLAGNQLGLVHRDISPDNLMLGFDGHVKVIDFGIALIKGRQAPVTEFGTLKGKPPYMSPEQVKNEPVDRRSDVFSLAVVLWEMLTGEPLFTGDSIYAVALAVQDQDIQPPSHVRGEPLPLGLDAAVMNALDRDLAHRTPTAAAFAEQLEQVIQSASDETLEAWAERALAGPRAEHRAWLAGVVTGRDAQRPIGRSTGSVTAVAVPGKPPPASAAAQPAPAALPAGELPAPPGVPTHLAPDRGEPDDVPDDDPAAHHGRRGRALPIALGALVAAALGGAIVLTRGGAPAARHDRELPPADAGVGDARRAVIDVPVSLVVDAAAPDAGADAMVDAGPTPDAAGPRRTVRPTHHAGSAAAPERREPERTAAPPFDAGAAGEARGFGTLTAKHTKDRFLNIVIDGRQLGTTPLFRKSVPAGTHTIELIDPQTSEVVTRRTVKVDVGQSVTIVEQ